MTTHAHNRDRCLADVARRAGVDLNTLQNWFKKESIKGLPKKETSTVWRKRSAPQSKEWSRGKRKLTPDQPMIMCLVWRNKSMIDRRFSHLSSNSLSWTTTRSRRFMLPHRAC